MSLQLLEIDPEHHQPHALHDPARDWMETNCAFDMWIEVLHALGLDPMPACACVLSTDFEGDQWTLFKFPPEDLRFLYGIEVSEMYVWRPVVEHLEIQLALGRMLTLEVDAWYLPDTAGVSYKIEHVKTGIMAQLVDRPARRLGYFHNAGYFELEGDDFDGIFGLDAPPDPRILLPYVELVKLDRLRRDDENALLAEALTLTRQHLARRARDHPMLRFKERLEGDLERLSNGDEKTFHSYAFATCRQVGATAEVGASFVDWLDGQVGGGLATVVDDLRTVATTAKGLQFTLARVARGRKVDLDHPFAELDRAWEAAVGTLVQRYG
jgi:hypothetical protein